MATVKQIKEDPYGKYLTKLAKVESGNNPNAKANTSSASGLYQFTESTWKGLTDKYKLNYSLDDRFDPVKSKKMAEILTKENENVLKNVLGRDLNDGERYLGHFLGSQGSKNLLSSYTKNPNQKVSEVVGGAALSANKSIFYNKDGSEKTVKDVYNWALKKMDINVDDQESTNYSESEYNPITTDVNNFFGSKKIPTLAGVPDMPQEEEKQKKEDKDVAELKQQTREQEFLREVQESYAQQPIQQEQPQSRQQTVAPSTNYIQTFEEVSNFIQNPIVAQQGVQKKPIYVESKNDPRYRDYQDSLKVSNYYNNIKKEVNITPNYQQGGTKTSNMLRVVSNMLNRGSSPKQILRSLVRMSVPRDVAQQLVQRASKPIKYNQQGGEYTESEIAFLSEIAIKDNQGQYNHPNKITEINSSNITMKGLDYPLLGISKETGETKIMKPNKDYKFGKGTKNVIEVPLKK